VHNSDIVLVLPANLLPQIPFAFLRLDPFHPSEDSHSEVLYMARAAEKRGRENNNVQFHVKFELTRLRVGKLAQEPYSFTFAFNPNHRCHPVSRYYIPSRSHLLQCPTERVRPDAGVIKFACERGIFTIRFEQTTHAAHIHVQAQSS
jgi:hypothetical protein